MTKKPLISSKVGGREVTVSKGGHMLNSNRVNLISEGTHIIATNNMVHFSLTEIYSMFKIMQQ